MPVFTLSGKKLYSFFSFLLVVCLVFALGTSDAFAKTKTKKHSTAKKHHRVVRRSHAPVVSQEEGARYADIVIDARTGRILHAVNAEVTRHPASLTKMMTLYITFQALESGRLTMAQRLPVSANAAAQSPTKLGLRSGQTIAVRDAILGLVTESANDAAVVLAEALGGTTQNFARMMTQQAQALGMTKTHFENPSGLPDPDQVTCARDMAMLAHGLIYHYPRFYPFFSQESYVYAGRTHRNHNHLMERYDGMDGIKTGYIRASGFNLVTSVRRGDLRLIGVVFGGRSAISRDNQMAQLLDKAFSVADKASHADQETAQGDSNDLPDEGTVSLPPKVSVAFRPRGAAIAATKPLGQPQASAPSNQDTSQPDDDSNGTWGIQVGAYGDQDQAQQLLNDMQRKMSPMLSRSTPVVQKVLANGGTAVYRARFVGMTQATARSICAYFIKHGQGCLLVPPDVAH